VIVAIVLAAGQGSRLGGPKALLLVRDPAASNALEIPLIEAQCRDRLAAESDRVLAVLRPDTAALVADRLRAAGAEIVVSHAPDALGPAGSLAAAAAYLGPAPALTAVVITPVDVRASAAAVRSLIGALSPGAGLPPLAAVPRFSGRKGHPVVLHPAALARYLAPDVPPLRDHLRALGDRVVGLDVDDPHVAEDLDFAHQTAMLLRITGIAGPARFFGIP